MSLSLRSDSLMLRESTLCCLYRLNRLRYCLSSDSLMLSPVCGSLQGGYLPFDVGLAYGILYSSPMVQRLREVHRIVLRPVGRVGIGGIGESSLEDDGLSHESPVQSDFYVGQPSGPCRFSAFFRHFFSQSVGGELQVLLHSFFKELVYT